MRAVRIATTCGAMSDSSVSLATLLRRFIRCLPVVEFPPTAGKQT
jgi:hypothetical protein